MVNPGSRLVEEEFLRPLLSGSNAELCFLSTHRMTTHTPDAVPEPSNSLKYFPANASAAAKWITHHR